MQRIEQHAIDADASIDFGVYKPTACETLGSVVVCSGFGSHAGLLCTLTIVVSQTAGQYLKLMIRFALFESLYGSCYVINFALTQKQSDGEAANICYRFRSRGLGAALATKRIAANVIRIAKGARHVGFNGIAVSSYAKFLILHIDTGG